jgi:hypothetical protein
VTRQVHTTVRIEIEGPDGFIEVLEGTPIHPVWSVDREDWVALGAGARRVRASCRRHSNSSFGVSGRLKRYQL